MPLTPMVLFDDADLDTAVPVLTAAITTFSGQFCMAGSRILAHRSVADELHTRLSAALEAVAVGRTQTVRRPWARSSTGPMALRIVALVAGPSA